MSKISLLYVDATACGAAASEGFSVGAAEGLVVVLVVRL